MTDFVFISNSLQAAGPTRALCLSCKLEDDERWFYSSLFMYSLKFILCVTACVNECCCKYANLLGSHSTSSIYKLSALCLSSYPTKLAIKFIRLCAIIQPKSCMVLKHGS